jgi:hypothetical protein
MRVWGSLDLTRHHAVDVSSVATQIVVDPLCKLILVVLRSGRIELREVATRQLKTILEGHSVSITSVAF